MHNCHHDNHTSPHLCATILVPYHRLVWAGTTRIQLKWLPQNWPQESGTDPNPGWIDVLTYFACRIFCKSLAPGYFLGYSLWFSARSTQRGCSMYLILDSQEKWRHAAIIRSDGVFLSISKIKIQKKNLQKACAPSAFPATLNFSRRDPELPPSGPSPGRLPRGSLQAPAPSRRPRRRCLESSAASRAPGSSAMRCDGGSTAEL